MRRSLFVIVAAVGVAAVFAAGGAKAAAKSSLDYVQDGLVAHWDGHENAGLFIHRADATKWVDLVNDVEVALPSWVAVEDHSLYSTCGTTKVATKLTSIAGLSSADPNWTVEVVMQGFAWTYKDSEGNLQAVFGTPRGSFGYRNFKDNGFYFLGPTSTSKISLQNWYHATAKVVDVHTVAATFANCVDSTANTIWMDGVQDAVNYNGNWNTTWGTAFSFFGNARMDIRVFAIRVYNRALTQAEVAANAAVDQTRFVNGEYFDDGFAITGEPEGIGASTPAYGVVAPSVGDTVTCRAPVAWTNDAATVRADCRGWRLVLADGTSTTGEETEKEIVYSAALKGAKLIWLWDVEYKATASADAGATVSVSEQWVKAGGTFTTVATVTDPATQAFSRWLDGADNVVSRDATLNATITEPMSFTAKLGGARYVGSGATDYPSVAEAFVGIRDYDTIFIRTGTHSMTNVCSITNAVTVRSETGDASDVTLTIANKGGHRHFVMNHAESALYGLTLANASESGSRTKGGSVCISSKGGTISHCVFSNNKTTGHEGQGGAVSTYSANALVTHCYFTGNRGTSGGGSGSYDYSNGGNAMLVGGGTVRNCLFVENGDHDLTSGKGGTIYLTSGTIESCTFANNRDPVCSGIRVNGANTTIRNCVFYGLDSKSASSELSKIMFSTSYSNKFSYCCAHVLINDGGTCVVSSDPFVDSAHGDWNPAGVLVDKAVTCDWMTGATDYAGNPRISGTLPDIGCYEKDQSQFGASVEPNVTSGISPVEVKYTVTVYGDVSQGVTCYWDWDGDGKWDDTSTGTTNHTYVTGTYATKVKVVNNAKPEETYEPDFPFAMTIVPKTIYVDDDSTEPVSPYGDPAHAATTVADAYAVALDGCEIVISNGTYSSSSTIEVLKGVRFRSWTGNPTNVILRMASGSKRRHFILNHAETALLGLTLADGAENNDNRESGGSILIRAFGGTISNCVFTGNSIAAWAGAGGAICMGSANALVTHCVFTNNCCANNDDAAGGNAISMWSGTIRNCLFVKNGKRDFKPGHCGTIYATGGTVESCTFANNADAKCAGISVGSGATVRNCVFYGGDCPSADSELQKIMYATSNSNRFSYCCAHVLINDGGTCVVSADPFVDAAHGDWNPAGVLVDKGVENSWMTGATDLAGNPRINGDYPDIGCYEKDQSQFSASVEASATEGIDPFKVTYTVTTFGTVTDGITCYWDWDGDGTWDGEPSAGTISHVYQVGTYSTKVKVVDNATKKEYAPPSPFAITAVPKTIYVAAESADPVSPYGDPAYAATTVADAYAVALDGCEIVISNGTYSFDSAIAVYNGVKFRSWTGNPADVILTMPNKAGYRHFFLNHADSGLYGLTLTNAVESGDRTKGGSVAISTLGGTISNCVFACNRTTGHEGQGGAVCTGSSKALVTHCVFTGNKGTSGGGSDSYDYANGGNAMLVGGGIVRNCLFYENGDHDTTSGKGGTIYLTGGTVESCTFANNRDPVCSGIRVNGSNTAIRNCIFYGLDSKSATNELEKIMFNRSYSDKFSYCCAPVLINDGGTCVVTDDPQFRNEARGDYRLRTGSPAIDKGIEQPWMTGATDLSGRPRIIHKIPDIGCYEAPGSGFTLIVR